MLVITLTATAILALCLIVKHRLKIIKENKAMLREELEELLDSILPSYEIVIGKNGRVMIALPFTEDNDGDFIEEQDGFVDEDEIFNPNALYIIDDE